MPALHALPVDAEAASLRLDLWLARRLPELSRARLQALIAAGDVLLDGAPTRPSARPRPGQTVTVRVPDPEPAEPAPEDIPVRIVHEDAHLLVVDKPAGLVVHPGAGRPSGTLVNALLHHVRDLSGVGGVLRPGIVHRLDKGTSGLLVVAKDDATHRALTRQFSARTTEKDYLAVVLGVPEHRQGVVDLPVGRDPRHRQRMSARVPRGREARTSWILVEAFPGAALLRLRIHTGRTHQIRVHLATVGHPVLGDATYGGCKLPASARPLLREALAGLTRPALHAARLAFTHPATGERVTFAADLPEDLGRLLEVLRR